MQFRSSICLRSPSSPFIPPISFHKSTGERKVFNNDAESTNVSKRCASKRNRRAEVACSNDLKPARVEQNLEHLEQGTAACPCVLTSSPLRDSVNRCVKPLRPPAPERLFSFRPKTNFWGPVGCLLTTPSMQIACQMFGHNFREIDVISTPYGVHCDIFFGEDRATQPRQSPQTL